MKIIIYKYFTIKYIYSNRIYILWNINYNNNYKYRNLFYTIPIFIEYIFYISNYSIIILRSNEYILCMNIYI